MSPVRSHAARKMSEIRRLLYLVTLALIAPGCGEPGRESPHRAGREGVNQRRPNALSGRMGGMKRYEYQCWEGGPQILLPNYLRGRWRGLPLNADPLDPSTDYGRACALTDDVGLLPVGAGQTLVLGQSPPMVAWSPRSPAGAQDVFILESWMVDLDALLDAVLAAAVFRETGRSWKISEPGASLCWAGDDPANPIVSPIEIPLAAGDYHILRFDFADPRKGQVVAIRLAPHSVPDRGDAGR